MQARSLFVAALVASAGCGRAHMPQLAHGGFIDPNPYAERAGILRVDWHRRIADWTTIEYRPVYHGAPAFDPQRRVVFAGSVDNGLYALRASDAAVLWRFATLGRVDSTPIVDNDLVIFGSGDGALYALDATTGVLRWRFPTSAEIEHPPVVFNNTVYFVNANDTVTALNRADGSVRWRYRRNPPGGITLSGHAGIVRVQNRIYTGFSDGNVVALDAADGSVAWEQDTSSDLENIEERNEAHQAIDVDTTPVVIGDTIYVASFTAGVYALDAVSGTRRWRRGDILHVAGVGTDGQHLFASSSSDGLVKLDPYDGSLVWARDMGSSAIRAVGSVGDGFLAVPLADQGLMMVRTSDGEPVDGIRPGSGFGSAPALFGHQFWAVSSGGVVYAVTLTPRPLMLTH